MKPDMGIVLIFVAWIVVGTIIAGVFRELDGTWDPDRVPLFMFWPLVGPIAAVFGAGWCIVWIGRAPVRWWRHRARRERLPRAEIARRS